ncbi:MAG: hypothetical protein IJ309_06615 [Clostridia bacterium]|nr:hypothetical protein [Clostridia bacterium]
MKKKIFPTLAMVFMLALVLVTTVFATEITYTADFAQTPEIVDGMPTPTTISTEGRVVLKMQMAPLLHTQPITF